MSVRLAASFAIGILLPSQGTGHEAPFDARAVAQRLVRSEKAAIEYNYAALRFSEHGDQKISALRQETLSASASIRAKMSPAVKARHDGCPLPAQNAVLVAISSVNASISGERWLQDRSDAYLEYRDFQKYYALIQRGHWRDTPDHDTVNKYMKLYRKRKGSPAGEVFKSAALDQFARDAVSFNVERASPSAKTIYRGLVTYDICFTDTNSRISAKSFLINSPNRFAADSDEEVDEALWLIAQHSDSDLAFQRMMLGKLEIQASRGDAYMSRYAYLYDRVAINSGGLQRYGTQMACNENNTWAPLATEDPGNLDERRAKFHLEPEHEYAQRGQFYCNK